MPSSHLIFCHPLLLLPQSLSASGSFPVSQLFAWGGQSTGVSASSVLPMNTQDWSPLGWTGWISLQSKGLSRVFSNTIVQKHQFFSTQLSSQSNSHITSAIFYWSHRLTLAQCGKKPHQVWIPADSIYWRLNTDGRGRDQEGSWIWDPPRMFFGSKKGSLPMISILSLPSAPLKVCKLCKERNCGTVSVLALPWCLAHACYVESLWF